MARAMACHSAAWSAALSPASRGCSAAGAAVKASLTEPKWKQKLAAADEKSLKIKQLTLQSQEEYRRRQVQKGESGDASKGLVQLADLQFLPYLSKGLINDCSQENAKVTLYAVFDEDKVLQYIGISRQIHHSMRLHFARLPQKCYFVKVYHSESPNRSVLEMTRDRWIAECSTPPRGNVDPREQYMWENPFDCKPLMTAEELKLHEEASAAKAKVLKDVARRIEKTLGASFDGKETLRFDPKLNERGLLNLRNLPVTPKRNSKP